MLLDGNPQVFAIDGDEWIEIEGTKILIDGLVGRSIPPSSLTLKKRVRS